MHYGGLEDELEFGAKVARWRDELELRLQFELGVMDVGGNSRDELRGGHDQLGGEGRDWEPGLRSPGVEFVYGGDSGEDVGDGHPPGEDEVWWEDDVTSRGCGDDLPPTPPQSSGPPEDFPSPSPADITTASQGEYSDGNPFSPFPPGLGVPATHSPEPLTCVEPKCKGRVFRDSTTFR